MCQQGFGPSDAFGQTPSTGPPSSWLLAIHFQCFLVYNYVTLAFAFVITCHLLQQVSFPATI